MYLCCWLVIWSASCVWLGTLMLDTLLPHLCAFVRADHIWCRICQRVFAHVPPRNLEAVVLPLLKKIPWYGLVDRFLGDCVLQNANIRSLISTKLLLHRHFQEPKLILHNIAGYLKSSRSRRPLFLEVFLSLLSVWGNKTSMQHISTEQHLYISQALLVFISALSDEEKTTHKDKALRLLMPGVTSHLENSDPQVRTVGMVVAKVLTQTIDPSGPQLDFELDKTNPMVTDLLSYQEIPDDPGPTAAEKAAATSWSKDTSNPDGELDKRMKSLSVKDTTQARMADLDLDSDDDLMPYDMSNDKKVSEAKHPKYVRECMEGLIYSTEDPDKLEVCLRHAEGVIRRKPDGLTEIAAEFAKILLHLQDTQSIENFATNRMLALVALAVTCPEPVAAYLIAQFYDRNYSLRQRMDILQVLTTASQELSQPDKTEEAKEAESSIEDISASTESSSWQEIVRKRIESNTRRFCKGRTTPEPTPTMNRFAPVAGSFFYPLMSKVDTKEPSLDLLGRDSMLLNKLLLALATILQSALNLPSITQMGRTLLDFTWPLRLHSDQCIRQSVLLAVTTVFVVVPISLVMTDLLAEVTEAKCWIEDVIEKDPDSQCQHLARQALFILNEQMKLEMKGPTV